MISTLISNTSCALGEGICISCSKDSIGWVDIVNKNLFIHQFSSKNTTCHLLDTTPSAILEIRNELVTLVDDHGLITYNVRTLKSTRKLFIEDLTSNSKLRANDACVSSTGDIYLGTMLFTPEKDTGRLYKIKNDKIISFDTMTIPNTFIELNDSILITDSHEQIIYSYKLTALHEKSVWYDFSRESFTPDGGTLASNGYIYIALWGGHGIAKFNQYGDLLSIRHVPTLQPTNCVEIDSFLYITSATVGLNEEEMDQYEYNGHTLKVEAF